MFPHCGAKTDPISPFREFSGLRTNKTISNIAGTKLADAEDKMDE